MASRKRIPPPDIIRFDWRDRQNEAALRGFKAGAESAYSNDRLAATFVTLSAKLGVALVASRAASANIVQPVTVQSGKWDYFFGRVASSEHNKFRSLQNLRDLNALGFDEAAGGRAALLKLFQDSQKLPEVARHVTDYGVTITRTARVGEIGAIDVKYFYPGGNMKAIPEVSSIIPKIFK